MSFYHRHLAQSVIAPTPGRAPTHQLRNWGQNAVLACPFPHLYTGNDGHTRSSWDAHRNKCEEDPVHSKCSVDLKALSSEICVLNPTDHHGSDLLFQTPLTLTPTSFPCFFVFHFLYSFCGGERIPQTAVPAFLL